MALPRFKRLPRHIAVIPDGNRRWAQARGLPKAAGYAAGIQPGLDLCDLCLELGIAEMTAYGFTADNTKRPVVQRLAFQAACVDGVRRLADRDVALLVVGNRDSPMFPPELAPYTTREPLGRSLMRANMLVNYDWQWDLGQALTNGHAGKRDLLSAIGSADVSRVDLVIRWGGRRRLSGLLPIQTVYADFCVLDDLWPDFTPHQFFQALRWYEQQEITLGG